MTAERVERRLAAVLAADVAGYSRLMGIDEEGTLARLKAVRKSLIDPTIASHRGRIVKTTGDGMLVEFASAVDAVRSAVEFQRGVTEHNDGVPQVKRIEFRIGIHVGDIIVDESDIFGDGVNIAARLEGIAEPGGVCISDDAYRHVRGKIEANFESMGQRELKNISEPIRVWRLGYIDNPKAGPRSEGYAVSKPVTGFGGRPAIAVLPFDNMSDDPEQVYFADGIADDILTRLSMWRWLPVIARNSSFAHRGKSVDLKRVGADLGARYILEGSVRKSGARVRVTCQLIDAETGHHLWAQRYEKVLEDIFSVQDEITDAIVTALEPAVGRAERVRASRKATIDLTAWDIYQRATWHYSQLTKESFAEAFRLCLLAGNSDPEFSSPLALASTVLRIGLMFDWFEPKAAGADCYKLSIEAKNRDPHEPLALAAYASVCPVFGKHDEAIQQAQLAIQLNPSFSTGHYCLGWVYMLDGNFELAISAMETSIRLSPQDIMLPQMFATLAQAYNLNKDYARAKEVAKLGIDAAQHYPMNYRSLAHAYAGLGQLDEGRESLRTFLTLVPGYSSAAAKAAIPFRREVDQNEYMVGLRKLGWIG